MMRKTKHMDLNKETAIRLWNKSFGKATKVKDYTGRTIAKGAYNDRNSEFGWNLDHILPQSRGGKTADYNLVCCHILTNDEKADRFPGFKANGIAFEIVKVENHYEIEQVGGNKKKKTQVDDEFRVNFMDSAAGVRFFKKLKGIQNQHPFVGTVFIRLRRIRTTALIDFIDKLFGNENITYSMNDTFQKVDTVITVKNYDMPSKDDIQEMLDKCVLLNTYLQCYFLKMEYLEGYEINYRVDHYDTKEEMYAFTQDVQMNKKNGWMSTNLFDSLNNSLYINNLVIVNTNAEEDVEADRYNGYTEYDFVYKRLEKNLEKEVDGK